MAQTAIVKPRDFTPADCDGFIAVGNRCYPDYPETVEEVRHRDETWDDTKYFRRRVVTEQDGRIVAAGDLNHSKWTFQADKLQINVRTDPDHRRRGIGSAIYDELERTALARGTKVLIVGVKESMEDGVRFAVARGFKEEKRDWESRLEVTNFDFSRFADAPKRVAEQGITITTLAAEMARDEKQALDEAYALDNDCGRDVPNTDAFTPLPFDDWKKEVLGSPNSLPEAFYLAVSPEGRYLGVSNLWSSLEDPSFIWQGLTGVRREARGKGVAMALKLRTVEYARDKGIREIKTWNDQRNRAMLRINEAMGFAKQPAWIEMRKTLGA